MTRESKINLLSAFDALCKIESGKVLAKHHLLHGGSARCDVCGLSLASGKPHEEAYVEGPDMTFTQLCPIGVSLKALMSLIPSFENRATFLDPPPVQKDVP